MSMFMFADMVEWVTYDSYDVMLVTYTDDVSYVSYL